MFLKNFWTISELWKAFFDSIKKIPIFGKRIAKDTSVSGERYAGSKALHPVFLREPTESIGAQALLVPGIERTRKKERKRGEEILCTVLCGGGNREGEWDVDRPASTLNPSRISTQCSYHDSRDTASVRAFPAIRSLSPCVAI